MPLRFLSCHPNLHQSAAFSHPLALLVLGGLNVGKGLRNESQDDAHRPPKNRQVPSAFSQRRKLRSAGPSPPESQTRRSGLWHADGANETTDARRRTLLAGSKPAHEVLAGIDAAPEALVTAPPLPAWDFPPSRSPSRFRGQNAATFPRWPIPLCRAQNGLPQGCPRPQATGRTGGRAFAATGLDLEGL